MTDPEQSRGGGVEPIVSFVEARAPARLNAAITQSRGAFVGVLHPEDRLVPGAVDRIEATIRDRPETDVLYTDERIVDSSGAVVRELRKPDYSPTRLTSQPYLGRLCVIRRRLIDEVGGVREGYLGAEEYDLALRATRAAREVVHLREVLVERSVPDDLLVPETRAQAAVRAVQEHVDRTDPGGTVTWDRQTRALVTRRPVEGSPLVSIVIPTRGGSASIRGEETCLVTHAVRGILEDSTYEHLEVVVVADSEMPDEVRVELERLAGDRLTLVPWTRAFNFSAKVNRGVAHARGEYILLLNDDVELITPDWIEQLLARVQRPGVVAAGPLLYFEDDSVQHGGHLYIGGAAGHIGFGSREATSGLPGYLDVDREVSGSTAACLLVARSTYFAVGGFSGDLPGNYNDVDFCMKLTRGGDRILWTPQVRLYHFESKSRVSSLVPYEHRTIQARWGSRMQTDPFWPV